MDPYLELLILFIIAISILILLFLLLIIILRIIFSVNQKRYQISSNIWEGYLFDYLQDEIALQAAAKHFIRKKNYKWLRTFFTPYLEGLDGRDFDKIKTLCHEIGLISYYQKKLRHSTDKGKAIAAKTLGSLRCQESVPDMIKLLSNNKYFVVAAAAQGLAKSGDTDSFVKVTRAMLKNTYFTYEGATEILTGYGEKICPVITQYLKEYIQQRSEGEKELNGRKLKKVRDKYFVEPSILISIMINLLGYFRYSKAVPQLGKILLYSDEETTVHVLKAFLLIGKVSDSFNVRPYLNHNYWVIRSFGAQIWKLTGDSKNISILEELLSDRHWWVRFHAASSLKDAGQEGLDILNRKTVESTGAAGDISRYILKTK